MVTRGEACECKRKLLQDLLQVFSRVSDMTTQGKVTSQNGDEQMELESMLQGAINEREQALIALENHQKEHGC
jgi:hypothetical protein